MGVEESITLSEDSTIRGGTTIHSGSISRGSHLSGMESWCLFVCCLFHSRVGGLLGGGLLEEFGQFAVCWGDNSCEDKPKLEEQTFAILEVCESVRFVFVLEL